MQLINQVKLHPQQSRPPAYKRCIPDQHITAEKQMCRMFLMPPHVLQVFKN